MNPALTKAQRRRIRELAQIAYDRELSVQLGHLETEFKRWRSGEIDSFALSERLHRFHQGPAQDLYSKYADSDLDWPVANAIHRGIIRPDETDAFTLEALASQLAFLRSQG